MPKQSQPKKGFYNMTYVLPTLKQDAELNTLVSSVCTNARTQQGALQEAIVQSVLAMKLKSNTVPLQNLVNNLPNSARVMTIMQYIKAHTPIKFVNDKDVHGNAIVNVDGRHNVKCRLRKGWVESDWQLESMFSTTFHSWKKPRVEKEIESEYNFIETIDAFVKKIDKILAKGVDAIKADTLRVQRQYALAAKASLA